MVTPYLLSTVVTGAVLLAVGAYVAYRYEWRKLVAAPAAVGGGVATDREGAAAVPLAAGVLAVTLLGGGIGLAIVSSAPMLGGLAGAFGGLLACYLAWGAYHIGRARGMNYAQGIGIGLWVLGLVFLVGIIARLLTG